MISYPNEEVAAPVYGRRVAVELLVGSVEAQVPVVHVLVYVVPVAAMVLVAVPASAMVVTGATSLATAGVVAVAVTPATLALNVTP